MNTQIRSQLPNVPPYKPIYAPFAKHLEFPKGQLGLSGGVITLKPLKKSIESIQPVIEVMQKPQMSNGSVMNLQGHGIKAKQFAYKGYGKKRMEQYTFSGGI